MNRRRRDGSPDLDWGKELNRHEAIQPAVLSFVDFAHAPFAKFFQKLIVEDGSTENGGMS